MTRSLNRGLALARGRYVARQDADDVSLPKRLARQVEYLDGHPDVGLLGTAYRTVGPGGERLCTVRPPAGDLAIRWNMLFQNAFCHSSVMFRRDLAARLGTAYDEGMRYSQDYDLWARMLTCTRGGNLPVPLLRLRKHRAAISTVHGEEQERLATLVALRQINALLRSYGLTESDVADMRRRWGRITPGLSQRRRTHYRRMVRLLLALVRRWASPPPVRRRPARAVDAVPLGHSTRDAAAGVPVRDVRRRARRDVTPFGPSRGARGE